MEHLAYLIPSTLLHLGLATCVYYYQPFSRLPSDSGHFEVTLVSTDFIESRPTQPIKSIVKKVETKPLKNLTQKKENWRHLSIVRDARLLKKRGGGNILPRYPRQDRIMGREGKVILLGFINHKGFVESTKIEKSSGSQLMEKEALKAFKQYQFKNGQAGWVRMPFHFVLTR